MSDNSFRAYRTGRELMQLRERLIELINLPDHAASGIFEAINENLKA